MKKWPGLAFFAEQMVCRPLCEAKNARDSRFLPEKGHPQFGNAPDRFWVISPIFGI
jgi:hypothetical protein